MVDQRPPTVNGLLESTAIQHNKLIGFITMYTARSMMTWHSCETGFIRLKSIPRAEVPSRSIQLLCTYYEGEFSCWKTDSGLTWSGLVSVPFTCSRHASAFNLDLWKKLSRSLVVQRLYNHTLSLGTRMMMLTQFDSALP